MNAHSCCCTLKTQLCLSALNVQVSVVIDSYRQLRRVLQPREEDNIYIIILNSSAFFVKLLSLFISR